MPAPGVLAELALEKYESEKAEYSGIVVSGVRSLGEAEAIKHAGGRIVFVDAPIEIRYERIKHRHRAGEEKLTFEQFKASEEAEELAVHDNPYVQDITGVKELADIIVPNDNDVEKFYKTAEQKLGFHA